MKVSSISEKKLLEQSSIQTYAREDWRCLPSRLFASRCAARCRGCRLANKLKSTYKCLFRRRKMLSQPKEEQQPQKALPTYEIGDFTPVSSSISLPEIFWPIDKHPETIEARQVEKRETSRGCVRRRKRNDHGNATARCRDCPFWMGSCDTSPSTHRTP